MTSKGFALLSAQVFSSEGFKVYLYEDLVATPLVPFGVNKLTTAGNIVANCRILNRHFMPNCVFSRDHDHCQP